MKLCRICHKISATGADHLDCVQRRDMESNAQDFKDALSEKLLKNDQELAVEVRAILEHISRDRTRE